MLAVRYLTLDHCSTYNNNDVSYVGKSSKRFWCICHCESESLWRRQLFQFSYFFNLPVKFITQSKLLYDSSWNTIIERIFTVLLTIVLIIYVFSPVWFFSEPIMKVASSFTIMHHNRHLSVQSPQWNHGTVEQVNSRTTLLTVSLLLILNRFLKCSGVLPINS